MLNINLPEREIDLEPICAEGFVVKYDCPLDELQKCESRKAECDCCIREIDCPFFNKASTEIAPNVPLPYIGSMTDTGLFEIRWDKEM